MTTAAAVPVRTAAVRRTAAGPALALRTGAVLAVVAGWQLLTQGSDAADSVLAPPSRVATVGLRYGLTIDSMANLEITTIRFVIAFVLSALVGVVLGVVLGRSGRHIFPAARDVTAVVYALPLVPFYPLLVLWLGLGARSEVAFGVLHGAIPVLLATMGAAATVDDNLLTAGRAMGASRRAQLTGVVLPAITADVVGALRTGAALSLLGVLLAELLISVDGVGGQIGQLISNGRAAELDAVILMVCVAAVTINSVLSVAERRLSRWRA